MIMDREFSAFSCQFGVLILLLVIGQATGCDYIHLEATTEEQSLDSHSDYGTYDYPNDYDKCWLIETPTFYTLKIWTDGNFGLEYQTDCGFDYLKIECREHADGDSGHIGTYCGSNAAEELQEGVYSSAHFSSVKFHTDGSFTYDGFRLYYQAVPQNDRDDCVANNVSASDERDERYSDESVNRTDNTVGIVIGVIFLVIIVIGVIIGIVACVCCGVAASHATSGRPSNYVTTYPVQYGHNVQGQTSVTVASPVITAANPALTPSQQYLPPVAHAPAYQAPGGPPAQAPAAGYGEPGAPPAFGTAPPAYENLTFPDKTHPPPYPS